jgi:hypothetical protein
MNERYHLYKLLVWFRIALLGSLGTLQVNHFPFCIISSKVSLAACKLQPQYLAGRKQAKIILPDP